MSIIIIRRLPKNKRWALVCSPLALISALVLCHNVQNTQNPWPPVAWALTSSSSSSSRASSSTSAPLTSEEITGTIPIKEKSPNEAPKVKQHPPAETFESSRIIYEPSIKSRRNSGHEKPNRIKTTRSREESSLITEPETIILSGQKIANPDYDQETALIKSTVKHSDNNSNQGPLLSINVNRAAADYAALWNGTASAGNVTADFYDSILMRKPATNSLDMVSSESVSRVDHNSDNPSCALILKRTYIIKSSAGNDEWGDKFVFNEVDPDVVTKRIQKSDLCIKYSDVDKAIEEAKHKIKFEKPDDLDSLEPSEASIGAIGELNLAVAQILTKKYDLSHDEILNALPMIDMSSSRFFTSDLCPKHVRPMICAKSRYRTISAHCNNLKHPSWGAAKTPYSRYLPPDYADGLTMPRAGQDGQPLPSARLITSIVHRDSDEPSNDYTALFASYGQLINHDITRHASIENPDCCPQYLKGNCMPIPVPQNDPLYSKFDVKCLKFDRSIAAIRPKCLLGLRAQVNLITSPIDASFVYGSTKSQANALRKFVNGKLKVWNYFEKLKLKPLLPPKTEDPDKDCLGRPKNLYCFMAGDVRANEQTHLTVLHTIHTREHNRLAKGLAQVNLEWDDDKLYHEARHILAACTQHIVVNEFLPLLLGYKYINEYKITPGDGFWNGYDPAVTTSTGTGFAAAAFRYGHSMVEGVIKRFDNKGHFIKGELLRFLFKRPFLLYEPGVIDELVMGMVLTPTEQTDPFVSEEISGHLFQPPKAKFGHDLAAINIQRGRDQGVPGYNDWREWCGLSRAKSFSDLEPLLMNKTAHYYSKIYKHVDDIDLWSAGVSERRLPGSAVGPTMACIISRQFLNFKRGDRFWYENPNQPSSFTSAQLKEIKKVTLAKILCTNADDIPKIQPWAMRLPHPIYNAKVSCESLPSINLKLWDSNQNDEMK